MRRTGGSLSCSDRHRRWKNVPCFEFRASNLLHYAPNSTRNASQRNSNNTGKSGANSALPIWSDFMRRTVRRLPAEPFPVPSGLTAREMCRVSYLRPVEGCPAYTEYFKDDDDVPGKLCPIHEGTFKQEAHRAVQGVLSGLGRAIKGIFK